MTSEPRLRAPQSMLRLLLHHLRDAPERMAFGLIAFDASNHMFNLRDIQLLAEADVLLRDGHAELTDEARQRLLSWASGTDLALFEAHSHRGPLSDPAAFSRLDIQGLTDWVPHVMWRLPDRPYVAVVVGETTFDGLVWLPQNPSYARQLKAFETDGLAAWIPTGRTLHRRRSLLTHRRELR